MQAAIERAAQLDGGDSPAWNQVSQARAASVSTPVDLLESGKPGGYPFGKFSQGPGAPLPHGQKLRTRKPLAFAFVPMTSKSQRKSRRYTRPYFCTCLSRKISASIKPLTFWKVPRNPLPAGLPPHSVRSRRQLHRIQRVRNTLSSISNAINKVYFVFFMVAPIYSIGGWKKEKSVSVELSSRRLRTNRAGQGRFAGLVRTLLKNSPANDGVR